MNVHRITISGVPAEDKAYLLKKAKKTGQTVSGLLKEIIRKERKMEEDNE